MKRYRVPLLIVFAALVVFVGLCVHEATGGNYRLQRQLSALGSLIRPATPLGQLSAVFHPLDLGRERRTVCYTRRDIAHGLGNVCVTLWKG